MEQTSEDFARLSEEHMAAAAVASSGEERIAHLEVAHRYAQIAVARRRSEGNVVMLGTRKQARH
jgi:hypothetical protein